MKQNEGIDMKCTKKMICEIFNEAAKEMGYKETQTNISNFKDLKIRWTRSANKSFIEFYSNKPIPTNHLTEFFKEELA